METSSNHCTPNPDIAGPGSFVVLGFAATFVPWLYLRENGKAWKDTIQSLGAAELATSWAILISTIHTYPRSLKDPHAVLGVYLALLASLSQGVSLWSGVFDDNIWPLVFRQTLNLALMFVLAGYLGACRGFNTSLDNLEGWIYSSFTAVLVISILLNVSLWVYSIAEGMATRRRKNNETETGTFWVLIATVFSLLLTATVLYLKYGLKECSLNRTEDNKGTFAQFFTVVMVLAPVVSMIEVVIKERTAFESVPSKSTSAAGAHVAKTGSIVHDAASLGSQPSSQQGQLHVATNGGDHELQAVPLLSHRDNNTSTSNLHDDASPAANTDEHATMLDRDE